ncbi:protein of unknown function [Sterolibacterium denitrificans]|uniref:Hydrogenase n=1 Tax=Sterolibacterium denitrificans TaxID=157592 RepID=A0A7Z7MVW0_9PROT|nr:nitrogen fixation protein NifQ [Sterolibacterium denitrificans]SMB28700.1 protein of unknown function [Sterolibacterium denitrificans]
MTATVTRREQMVAQFMCAPARGSLATESFARRTISGVMRNAQAGELPLFAWTLGLAQPALLEVVATHFPELGVLEPMPEQDYEILMRGAPPLFTDMVGLLMNHGAAESDRRHTEWLARAIAAAAMGERHLWQDAGLSDRAELSSLLAQHFPALHARNTQNLKWKRFLFGELGALLGIEDLRPPGCGKCEQIALCFPEYKRQD